eukprot:Gb_08014 [translate_table: standard]
MLKIIPMVTHFVSELVDLKESLGSWEGHMVLHGSNSGQWHRSSAWVKVKSTRVRGISLGDILVATPGRLLDHIENTPGVSNRLMGLKVLILDEADHLLDMGFRKDLEKIIDAVPRQRQSLLFSATIPQEVHQISQIALRRDHTFINTVGVGCQETHTKVLQTYLVTSHENHFHVLCGVLRKHILHEPDYKVLVFCTTGAVTRIVYEVLLGLNFNVREIHSRKSQVYRTRMSDEFRNSKGLILVTSDVSARGVDYPDVTLVVQLGGGLGEADGLLTGPLSRSQR